MRQLSLALAFVFAFALAGVPTNSVPDAALPGIGTFSYSGTPIAAAAPRLMAVVHAR